MKTKICCAFFVMIYCVLPMSSFAHSPSNLPLFYSEWTPLQVGVWPYDLFSTKTRVYGIDFNFLLGIHDKSVYGISIAPFLGGGWSSAGLSIAPFFAGAFEHRGLIISQVTLLEKNYGLQIGLLNLSEEGFMEIGLVNISDHAFLQIGVYNMSAPHTFYAYVR